MILHSPIRAPEVNPPHRGHLTVKIGPARQKSATDMDSQGRVGRPPAGWDTILLLAIGSGCLPPSTSEMIFTASPNPQDYLRYPAGIRVAAHHRRDGRWGLHWPRKFWCRSRGDSHSRYRSLGWVEGLAAESPPPARVAAGGTALAQSGHSLSDGGTSRPHFGAK
jgi:hypothetical protein